MSIIFKTRTIRPSTRGENAKYKISTKGITSDDVLHLMIKHESKKFVKTYLFEGKDVAKNDNLFFTAIEKENTIDIALSGVPKWGELKITFIPAKAKKQK